MSERRFTTDKSPQACQYCGAMGECKPYGINDEQICFECAMKDKDTTERKIAIYLFGDDDE